MKNTFLLSIILGLGVITLLIANSDNVFAACTALPTDRGQATVTINVPTAGSYRVWSRILASSSSNNSYFLQIDDTYCNVVVGDAVIPTNTYTWVDYQSGSTSNKITVSLTAGSHTLKLAGREDNVRVDKVMVLGDTACIPTNFGTNCTSASAPSGTTGGSQPSQPSSVTSNLSNSQNGASPSSGTQNNDSLYKGEPAAITAISKTINKPIAIPLAKGKKLPLGVLLIPPLIAVVGSLVWFAHLKHYNLNFSIDRVRNLWRRGRVNAGNKKGSTVVSPTSYGSVSEPGSVISPESIKPNP